MLVIRGFLWLLIFDFYLSRRRFHSLNEMVRQYRVRHRAKHLGVSEICAALDLACIWYWKPVLCLQRSAATTCLLRSYGIPARMVLAAQTLPFKAHAWVEVDEVVVSDKPYMREIYQVLDLC